MSQPTRFTIYLFMSLMLLFGTANTIIGKLMDQTSIDGVKFQHPYFQTACMFFGELLCLGIYQAAFKQDLEEQDTPLIRDFRTTDLKQKLKFAISALFDAIASTLMFIGLVLTAPSVYQMLRGFLVVVVAVYSKVLLKRKIFLHQIIGVICVTVGVGLIGLANVYEEQGLEENPTLGVILLIVGQFSAGAALVVQEGLLQQINIHPIQVVGIEGACGLSFYLILLGLLQLVPCHYQDLCSNGVVEDSINAFYQLSQSLELVILVILFTLSIAMFNWTGVETTKNVSALARSTIETSRTALVWVISLALKQEEFSFIQLGGFVLLTLGTMIYNEVVVFPCMKASVNSSREYQELSSRDDKSLE